MRVYNPVSKHRRYDSDRIEFLFGCFGDFKIYRSLYSLLVLMIRFHRTRWCVIRTLRPHIEEVYKLEKVSNPDGFHHH
jgi:hypothetical protein